MVKKLLYTFVIAAGLVSCSEDYTDWNNPQHNDAEEAAAAAYGVQFSGSGVDVNMEDANCPQTIKVVSMATSNPEVDSLKYASIKINGQVIPYTIEGNDAYVSTFSLDSCATVALNSRKYEKRELNVEVEATVFPKSGTAVAVKGELTQNETPVPTPAIDPKGYYLLGAFEGCGWDPTKPIYMKETAEGSGIYKAVVTTSNAASGNYWGIYGTSRFVSGSWDDINKSVYGSATADNSAKGGLLVHTSDNAIYAPNGVKSMVIPEGKAKYQITFDANNMTYTVANKYDDLFLTGSNYNNWKTWKQLTPVKDSDTDFWTILYLHANEEFKFAPQAAWGDDFGYIGAEKIKDEAGAGIVDNGGNLKVTNAGWYLIHVTNGDDRAIEITKPEVYVFGSAAGGKWDFDSAPKCTIPTTEDGNFVTPALNANTADEDDGLRLCVKIGNFDWWKTEFIVRDGKIEMRGQGGDQKPRVKVTEGQKVYFNFKTMTGEIK